MIILLVSGCSNELGSSDFLEKEVSKDTLDIIARPSMNGVHKYVDNWYLFYNDRIYVYLYGGSNSMDEFFSTDLNGDDKKIISESLDLRLAELYLIYDNYAFYYTTYNQGIKKIDLETGEIFSVIDDTYLYLIPDTLQEGKVLVEYSNNIAGESHVFVGRLDLNSGILSDEKILPFIGRQTYSYSSERNKVYFCDSEKDLNNIYEDNSIIYTYPSSLNNNDFAFTQDNYIYVVTNDKIIKLDIDNHKLIEEKTFINNGYSLYSSVHLRSHSFGEKVENNVPLNTLEKPFFYAEDNSTLIFDSEKMEFIKIADVGYAFIQKINNYVIFQKNASSTSIYDENNGQIDIYSSSNFGIDDESLYMMTFTGDFYYQNSNICEFSVKKIDLND